MSLLKSKTNGIMFELRGKANIKRRIKVQFDKGFAVFKETCFNKIMARNPETKYYQPWIGISNCRSRISYLLR